MYSIGKRPNTKALGGKFDTTIIQFVYIDVNGNKPPNIAGRDLFIFTLAEDGHLYPLGGKDDAIFYCQKSITDTSNNCYWKNSNDCSSSGSGDQCAARIIENGWKMDY